MKQKYILLLLGLSILNSVAIGQQRYIDQVFDNVEVQKDIIYGSNYTALFLPIFGTTTLIPLEMDLYQPMGDTVSERPLVIMLHTGNFLPIQVNGGVTGSKADSAVVEVSTRLAKMGYVVASADYRLGWDPFAAMASLRTLGLINAAYRSLQDVRSCVRFFRRDKAEGGDNFRIDTSRIVMWGQGTGGYIALAAATLDEYLDIVNTEMPPDKFIADLNGDGVPDPMIVELFNGDIYGTSVGVSPGGLVPAGDTLSIPNHPGYSSKFHLCVNMGGALADIGWLQAGQVPTIGFQVPLDQFAPYESAILGVPSPQGSLPVVEVQGAKLVAEKSNTLGNNDVFRGIDDEITDAAIRASERAGHEYYEGLYPFNRPLNSNNLVDGSPWNWWEPSFWDTIPSPTIPGLSYHQVALLANPMSPEKGRAYIDTIMAYYAPRAVLALGLADTTSTDVPNLDRLDVGLVISPNPSQGFLQARSHVNNPMQQIRVLDYTGRTLLERRNLHTNQISIDHTHIPTGMYLVEVRFAEGRVVEKVGFD